MDSEPRRRWIWPLVAAAAVVAIVAVEFGQGRDPDRDSVSAASEPAASEEPAMRLLVPGEVVTIAAVDPNGTWGEIAITRGPDAGGYPDNPIEPEAFIIEVFIDYTAARYPEPEAFGREDWDLATATDRRPVGSLYEWILPPNPAESDLSRQELGSFPGAIEIIGGTTEGMLYFQVPREVADQELELIYRPVGFAETVTAIRIREGDPAPAPVPTATPVPTPAPGTYVARDGSPFTVTEHREADALFVDPDTCTNPVGGYTVAYPDSWYTNTEFGDLPACSWFSPTTYEVTTSDAVPKEVVITATVIPGPMGSFTISDRSLDEPVPIGGRDGRRWEEIGVIYEGGGYEALPPSYHYYVVLGDPAGDGPRILVSSRSEGVDDYVLNKAALDRIMASLEFTD